MKKQIDRGKTGETKRREFCKKLSCAAIGAFSLLGSQGTIFGKSGGLKSSEKSLTKEEENMAKKITGVTAKVISVKGTCGLGHKVGDVIKFTESGVEGKICIHALYSMLPAVFAMMYDARFPWLEDPDKKTHPCTDAANPVVFELKRVREA